MKLTWFGTASIALETEHTRILFDPFIRRNKKLQPVTVEDFTGYDAILITHGHFDHLMDVPKVMNADADVPVYCTKTPRASLMRKGIPPQRIHCFERGDEFTIGDFTVRAHAGHHVDFNMNYISSVLSKCVLQGFRSLWMLRLIRKLPEGNEIVVYEVQAEGKTVLIMGSYGIDAMTVYPKNPDVMVFPYAGNTNLASIAAGCVASIRPQTIIFDHFDDAFPPLTKRMDVEDYCALLRKMYPNMGLIIPREETPLTI